MPERTPMSSTPMPSDTPSPSDNRLATGITVATAVALILAVGFSYLGAPHADGATDVSVAPVPTGTVDDPGEPIID